MSKKSLFLNKLLLIKNLFINKKNKIKHIFIKQKIIFYIIIQKFYIIITNYL